MIGEFQKRAVVWSNDSERRSIALYLKGAVTPLISLEPGGYVGLWGVKGQVPVESIDIINNLSEPINITGIDNDLPLNIKFTIEEIKPGFTYRLKVGDISNETGEYVGHLKVRTDHPRKPEFVVVVNGYITDN